MTCIFCFFVLVKQAGKSHGSQLKYTIKSNSKKDNGKGYTFTISISSIILYIKPFKLFLLSGVLCGPHIFLFYIVSSGNLIYFQHLVAVYGDDAKSFTPTQILSLSSRFKSINTYWIWTLDCVKGV